MLEQSIKCLRPLDVDIVDWSPDLLTEELHCVDAPISISDREAVLMRDLVPDLLDAVGQSTRVVVVETLLEN